MHKEDVLSTIVYILMVAVAIALGFAVIAPAFNGAKDILGMKTTLFIILGILVSIILNVVLFEVAHIIGGKIGGYNIKRVNCLGLEFRKNKDSNKVEVKFPKGFDGLTGETFITPKDENSNPRPYTLAPLVLFVIEIVLLILCYIFIHNGKQDKGLLPLKYFQVLMVSIGGMLFIYDYFPAKIDSLTDGYRIVLISKKINVKAFNTLLKIQSEEVDVSSLEVFEEITDFTALVNLEIAKNGSKKYEEITDKILEAKDKISKETYFKASAYKIKILIDKKEFDSAKDFYNLLHTKGKEYIKSEYTIDTIKTALLYFGLIEFSEAECNHQIEHIKNALDGFSRKKKEEEIYKIQGIIKLINESQEKFKLIY